MGVLQGWTEMICAGPGKPTELRRPGAAGGGDRRFETCVNLPFGDGQSCTGTDVSPLHFMGKQGDTETSLDAFEARYFNSGMARWLTPDWSVRPEGTPYASLASPQTLNLYAYVGNSPVTHTDPDGHMGPDPYTYHTWIQFGEWQLPYDSDFWAGTESLSGGDETASQQVSNPATTNSNSNQPPASHTAKVIKKVLKKALKQLKDAAAKAAKAAKDARAAEQKWLSEHPNVLALALLAAALAGGGEAAEGEGEAAGEAVGEGAGAPKDGSTAGGSEVNVTFGHGARHLDGADVSQDAVESAIRSQLQSTAASSGATGTFWGRIQVSGQTIEFRAYTLPDGTINVGMYYPVKP